MSAPTRTPRGTWIQAGLRAVADGGPDAVRIEPLAKALGVTRGGFYWHFVDRQALLDEILDAWERAAIDEVLERVERRGGDPRTKARRAGALTLSDELLPSTWPCATGRGGILRWRGGCGGSTTAGWSTSALSSARSAPTRTRPRPVRCSRSHC